MSAQTSYRLLVLFDDEIRTAAKLIAEFRKAHAAKDESAGRRAADALLACEIALEGADGDDMCVIINAHRKAL